MAAATTAILAGAAAFALASVVALRRPGSGLGLAIVGAVAERHGGRGLVDGSAFTIALPETR